MELSNPLNIPVEVATNHLKEYQKRLDGYFRDQMSDVDPSETEEQGTTLLTELEINTLLGYIYKKQHTYFSFGNQTVPYAAPFERIGDLAKIRTEDNTTFYYTFGVFLKLRRFPEPLMQILAQFHDTLLPFTHIIAMYDFTRDIRDTCQYFRTPESPGSAKIQKQNTTSQDDPSVAVDETSAKELIATLSRGKINYDEVIRGLFEQFPEAKTFNSSRLLRFLQGIAKKRDLEITIGDSRIRQLPVWKENEVHRRGGDAQHWGEMGDVVDEDAADVNDPDYEVSY